MRSSAAVAIFSTQTNFQKVLAHRGRLEDTLLLLLEALLDTLNKEAIMQEAQQGGPHT